MKIQEPKTALGTLVPAAIRIFNFQFEIAPAGRVPGARRSAALVGTSFTCQGRRLRRALAVWRTTTNTVVISWPQSDVDWVLHATTNLVTGGSVWTELLPPHQTNGANLQFTEPSPVGPTFYRLHNPQAP